jgi:5-methylcytosine-specific restriction endonuclease McrA
LNCEVCGESYKVPESRIGRSSYCSKKCRTKKLTDTCDHCGREFEVKRCNKGRFRFCGRECEGAFKSRKLSGSNAPNWKGGTDLYYGANWQEARRVVRNRDCFRCQRCGTHEDEHDTELHVHHIVPLREFDEPEDANTPSNLVTVCPSCHGEVEGDVGAGRALL